MLTCRATPAVWLFGDVQTQDELRDALHYTFRVDAGDRALAFGQQVVVAEYLVGVIDPRRRYLIDRGDNPDRFTKPGGQVGDKMDLHTSSAAAITTGRCRQIPTPIAPARATNPFPRSHLDARVPAQR